MDKLPVYNLIINDSDDDSSGVLAVALVDTPATEQNWVAFEKQTQFKFQSTNAEKHIISGADRKSTRLNSSHVSESRMPSSA